MADTRDIEASRPEFEAKMRAAGCRDDRHDTGEYVGVTSYRWEGRIAALASRPAEVDESPKLPRTPEEMVAFIGSHFDAMRDETSDPEDIRFTLSVHDLLSAMSDWFDDYAESAYSNEKAAEVDDWVSVEERMPEVGMTVMVYSPPTKHDWPDARRIDFDYLDPDADEPRWFNHGEHYEHFCCVAKPEDSIGPSEEAPYTHWRPIPSAPSHTTNKENG